MQEETHLIILHIHPCYILFIIVVGEYQDVKIETGQEPKGPLVVFLQNEVRQLLVRFVSVGMRLVDAFGNAETARVYPFRQLDILPKLHPTLTVHVELDLVRKM